MTDKRHTTTTSQAGPTHRDGAAPEDSPMWATANTMARAIEPSTRAMSCANFEMTSLVGHRIRAYATIPETLRQCRSPLDVVHAQIAFWQEAGNHYKAATEHILSAWSSVLSQASSAEAPTDERRDVMVVSETNSVAAEPERRRPGDDRRAA